MLLTSYGVYKIYPDLWLLDSHRRPSEKSIPPLIDPEKSIYPHPKSTLKKVYPPKRQVLFTLFSTFSPRRVAKRVVIERPHSFNNYQVSVFMSHISEYVVCTILSWHGQYDKEAIKTTALECFGESELKSAMSDFCFNEAITGALTPASRQRDKDK